MSEHDEPTDPAREESLGRVGLWLDPADLEWLSRRCACGPEAGEEERERCARLRFRAGAALRKSGWMSRSWSEIEQAVAQDAAQARLRGIRVQVRCKAARHAPWEMLAETGDLREAFATARGAAAFENGIFLVEEEDRGFEMLYWSSRWPDELNQALFADGNH